MRIPTSIIILLTVLGFGCTKLTNVDGPPNRFDNPFQDDASATSLILGIYEKNVDRPCLYNGHLSRCGGLQSGELIQRSTSNDDADFQYLRIKSNNRSIASTWTPGYECISRCNLVIQDLPSAMKVSKSIKPVLLGEALFLRALSYFYLVTLFDSIPLITGVDIGENALIPQVSSKQIFDQIVIDLDAALLLLPEKHPDTQLDSLRHTRAELGAVRSLLARVYLYEGNYELAANYAGLVINQDSYSLEAVQKAFQYTSRDIILQFKPVMPNASTVEGLLFLQDRDNIPNYELTSSQMASFLTGDYRKTAWSRLLRSSNVDRWQPRKYQIKDAWPRQEYNIVFRLAEQYLIRAEARLRLGDVVGAMADLEAVRQRAGLPQPPANSTTVNLLRMVARERQAELFTEWGHRMFDLHRWWRLPAGDILQDYADSILKSQPTWQPFMIHWPIPLQELNKNPRLHQNEGYN